MLPALEQLGLDWMAEELVAAWQTDEDAVRKALVSVAQQVIDEDF